MPGKPRVFLPYIDGFAKYAGICAEIAAAGYRGFRLSGGEGVSVAERSAATPASERAAEGE